MIRQKATLIIVWMMLLATNPSCDVLSPAVTPTLTATSVSVAVDEPTATASATRLATPTLAPTAVATSTPTITAAAPSMAPTRPPTETPTTIADVPSATPHKPSPTATATTETGLLITYFRADTEEADPGDTISLEWNTTGAEVVSIYHMLGGQLSEPFWEVGATGAVTYTISELERNSTDFVLYATAGDSMVYDTLSVTIRCPDTWFFEPAPTICPAAAPLESVAAVESFENGTMVWVEQWDQIYVLFADELQRQWLSYRDTWSEGEPILDPDLDPPAGLYQPQRGFGKVWREELGVRTRLGWATGPEIGYVTFLQSTSRYKYNDLYLRAANGDVWKLGPEGSGWERFSP